MNRLTREQAAIIGAYTGFTFGPFEDIHAKVEQVLGRPVWTHELASQKIYEEIRARLKDELIAVCAIREPDKQVANNSARTKNETDAT